MYAAQQPATQAAPASQQTTTPGGEGILHYCHFSHPMAPGMHSDQLLFPTPVMVTCIRIVPDRVSYLPDFQGSTRPAPNQCKLQVSYIDVNSQNSHMTPLTVSAAMPPRMTVIHTANSAPFYTTGLHFVGEYKTLSVVVCGRPVMEGEVDVDMFAKTLRQEPQAYPLDVDGRDLWKDQTQPDYFLTNVPMLVCSDPSQEHMTNVHNDLNASEALQLENVSGGISKALRFSSLPFTIPSKVSFASACKLFNELQSPTGFLTINYDGVKQFTCPASEPSLASYLRQSLMNALQEQSPVSSLNKVLELVGKLGLLFPNLMSFFFLNPNDVLTTLNALVKAASSAVRSRLCESLTTFALALMRSKECMKVIVSAFEADLSKRDEFTNLLSKAARESATKNIVMPHVLAACEMSSFFDLHTHMNVLVTYYKQQQQQQQQSAPAIEASGDPVSSKCVLSSLEKLTSALMHINSQMEKLQAAEKIITPSFSSRLLNEWFNIHMAKEIVQFIVHTLKSCKDSKDTDLSLQTCKLLLAMTNCAHAFEFFSNLHQDTLSLLQIVSFASEFSTSPNGTVSVLQWPQASAGTISTSLAPVDSKKPTSTKTGHWSRLPSLPDSINTLKMSSEVRFSASVSESLLTNAVQSSIGQLVLLLVSGVAVERATLMQCHGGVLSLSHRMLGLLQERRAVLLQTVSWDEHALTCIDAKKSLDLLIELSEGLKTLDSLMALPAGAYFVQKLLKTCWTVPTGTNLASSTLQVATVDVSTSDNQNNTDTNTTDKKSEVEEEGKSGAGGVQLTSTQTHWEKEFGRAMVFSTSSETNSHLHPSESFFNSLVRSATGLQSNNNNSTNHHHHQHLQAKSAHQHYRIVTPIGLLTLRLREAVLLLRDGVFPESSFNSTSPNPSFVQAVVEGCMFSYLNPPNAMSLSAQQRAQLGANLAYVTRALAPALPHRDVTFPFSLECGMAIALFSCQGYIARAVLSRTLSLLPTMLANDDSSATVSRSVLSDLTWLLSQLDLLTSFDPKSMGVKGEILTQLEQNAFALSKSASAAGVVALANRAFSGGRFLSSDDEMMLLGMGDQWRPAVALTSAKPFEPLFPVAPTHPEDTTLLPGLMVCQPRAIDELTQRMALHSVLGGEEEKEKKGIIASLTVRRIVVQSLKIDGMFIHNLRMLHQALSLVTPSREDANHLSFLAQAPGHRRRAERIIDNHLYSDLFTVENGISIPSHDTRSEALQRLFADRSQAVTDVPNSSKRLGALPSPKTVFKILTLALGDKLTSLTDKFLTPLSAASPGVNCDVLSALQSSDSVRYGKGIWASRYIQPSRSDIVSLSVPLQWFCATLFVIRFAQEHSLSIDSRFAKHAISDSATDTLYKTETALSLLMRSAMVHLSPLERGLDQSDYHQNNSAENTPSPCVSFATLEPLSAEDFSDGLQMLSETVGKIVAFTGLNCAEPIEQTALRSRNNNTVALDGAGEYITDLLVLDTVSKFHTELQEKLANHADFQTMTPAQLQKHMMQEERDNLFFPSAAAAMNQLGLRRTHCADDAVWFSIVNQCAAVSPLIHLASETVKHLINTVSHMGLKQLPPPNTLLQNLLFTHAKAQQNFMSPLAVFGQSPFAATMRDACAALRSTLTEWSQVLPNDSGLILTTSFTWAASALPVDTANAFDSLAEVLMHYNVQYEANESHFLPLEGWTISEHNEVPCPVQFVVKNLAAVPTLRLDDHKPNNAAVKREQKALVKGNGEDEVEEKAEIEEGEEMDPQLDSIQQIKLNAIILNAVVPPTEERSSKNFILTCNPAHGSLSDVTPMSLSFVPALAALTSLEPTSRETVLKLGNVTGAVSASQQRNVSKETNLRQNANAFAVTESDAIDLVKLLQRTALTHKIAAMNSNSLNIGPASRAAFIATKQLVHLPTIAELAGRLARAACTSNASVHVAAARLTAVLCAIGIPIGTLLAFDLTHVGQLPAGDGKRFARMILFFSRVAATLVQHLQQPSTCDTNSTIHTNIAKMLDRMLHASKALLTSAHRQQPAPLAAAALFRLVSVWTVAKQALPQTMHSIVDSLGMFSDELLVATPSALRGSAADLQNALNLSTNLLLQPTNKNYNESHQSHVQHNTSIPAATYEASFLDRDGLWRASLHHESATTPPGASLPTAVNDVPLQLEFDWLYNPFDEISIVARSAAPPMITDRAYVHLNQNCHTQHLADGEERKQQLQQQHLQGGRQLGGTRAPSKHVDDFEGAGGLRAMNPAHIPGTKYTFHQGNFKVAHRAPANDALARNNNY